jgi:RNA polymerase sigma-70 factor (ECF subfamily)
MSPSEEHQLLQRCCAGDSRAWDQFFDEHYQPVARFVFQAAPDATREDVEEICQETFLAAIRSIDGFSGKSRIQTWLFRIASNKAMDFRDRRNAAKRGGGRAGTSLDEEDPETGLRAQLAASEPGPDGALLAAEEMAEVRRGLDELGNPCREILELRYFADLDYEAIGRALELPTKTVSSRLSRCLDRLGEILTRSRAKDAEQARRRAV